MPDDATPKEPGWYLFATAHAWWPQEVVPASAALPWREFKAGDARLFTRGSDGGFTSPEDFARLLPGTWGPRIPEPDRLTALEELATAPPRSPHGPWCQWCTAMLRDDDTIDHTPDCPWLRAQKKE